MGIKTGDEVRVIAGNDRGKTGKVTKSLPSVDRVVVEGVNIRAKHVKGEDSGIVRTEAPIHVSNVVLATKKTAKKASSAKSATKPKADKSTEDSKSKKANSKKTDNKTTKAKKTPGDLKSVANPSTEAQDKETKKK